MSDDDLFNSPTGFDDDEEQRGSSTKTNGQGREMLPAGPWDQFPELWDVLQMEDKDWPGIATITHIKRGHKWDTKKAKGQHGGKRSYAGVDHGTIEIQIIFWRADQLDEILKTFLPLVEPDPAKDKPRVLKISHAVADARKLKYISIDDVEGPVLDGRKGKITLKATEEKDPNDQNATGAATKNSGGGANCQQLATEYQQLQTRNRQLAETYNSNLKYYQSQDSTVQLASQEQFGQAQQNTYAEVAKNNARMEQIAAEQKRRGCPGSTEAKPSSQSQTTGPGST